MSPREFSSEQDKNQYLIYRQRIEEFLHLFLSWEAMERSAPAPPNVMGHGPKDFAQTLRTATIGWLASLVDEHKAALNVFDLWLKIFPERSDQITRVRDEIRPHIKLLIDFRNNTAFHANKSVGRHAQVRKAIQNPDIAKATQSFLELAIDILKNDNYGVTIGSQTDAQTGWIQLNVSYQGNGRAEFQNPIGTVEGYTTAFFNEFGESKFEMHVQDVRSERELHFGLMEFFSANKPTQTGKAIVMGWGGEFNPCSKVVVETTDGILEAEGNILYGLQGMNLLGGAGGSIVFHPLRCRFRVKQLQAPTYWALPLLNFVSEFRPHFESALDEHPLRVPAQQNDEASQQRTAGRIVFLFNNLPGFIEPLPDYDLRKTRLLSGRERTAATDWRQEASDSRISALYERISQLQEEVSDLQIVHQIAWQLIGKTPEEQKQFSVQYRRYREDDKNPNARDFVRALLGD